MCAPTRLIGLNDIGLLPKIIEMTGVGPTKIKCWHWSRQK